ncbi:hypothetical protein [Cohnella silvisoli]|uniref:Two-component sensor histidine kinase n=1 Tax=Cohnella silvisoli TaxID=2873699 RepID=A0ABV1KWL6_9BACL|nr:hypothetical protein [Cohnella silvisoli]
MPYFRMGISRFNIFTKLVFSFLLAIIPILIISYDIYSERYDRL